MSNTVLKRSDSSAPLVHTRYTDALDPIELSYLRVIIKFARIHSVPLQGPVVAHLIRIYV
jgi:hypothetical protein